MTSSEFGTPHPSGRTSDIGKLGQMLIREFERNTKKLLEEFDKDSKGGQVTLTSVGQAIAIANLSKSLGRLDYSIWIK